MNTKNTVWKVSKYGLFSGPNTAKYLPEKLRILTLFTQWKLVQPKDMFRLLVRIYEEYQELKGDSTKEQVYDKIDQILFSFKNKRYNWQMKYNILEEETLRFV